MLTLIAAASIFTAVDAERAFAQDAKAQGQWTAFRKWADDDAVMFTPQAVWAQEFLKHRKNPPKSVSWAPAESWVSCDGRTAINRGPWTSASGGTGYFTTVWMRHGRTWRWSYDGGDTLARPTPLPRQVRLARASCSGRSKIPGAYRRATKPTERIAGKPPADAGQGRSADGTLIYEWKVSAEGARHFEAKLWNGRSYRTILDQKIPAPAQ